MTLKQFLKAEQARLGTTGSLSTEEEVLLEFDVKRLEFLPLSKHGLAMSYVEQMVDGILTRRPVAG